ncbi:hypothetical protein HD553DRAFT_322675 [Filobasidium floriforme]|uniref:uncharacterized protein n=1 Tax=Filobasidium floriforme TaxID=5210 RepID=UPI001E8D4604|nr:uncharacterized protein HD553DRAFT_322675 [Filobasidium floriforme]KAH8088192.1 hypothetical protein HD553DRAFT_322675 [Filobasidium floriforme]
MASDYTPPALSSAVARDEGNEALVETSNRPSASTLASSSTAALSSTGSSSSLSQNSTTSLSLPQSLLGRPSIFHHKTPPGKSLPAPCKEGHIRLRYREAVIEVSSPGTRYKISFDDGPTLAIQTTKRLPGEARSFRIGKVQVPRRTRRAAEGTLTKTLSQPSDVKDHVPLKLPRRAFDRASFGEYLSSVLRLLIFAFSPELERRYNACKFHTPAKQLKRYLKNTTEDVFWGKPGGRSSCACPCSDSRSDKLNMFEHLAFLTQTRDSQTISRRIQVVELQSHIRNAPEIQKRRTIVIL